MTDFYSSAASVLTRTGIKPDDLGIEDDDALATFLEDTLTEITDLMDRMMKQSHLADDPVPAGLNGIAGDIAANAIREMVATRQTPVVRIDDFAITVIQSMILSPDIQKRLRLYAVGAGQIEMKHGDLAPSDARWFTLEDLNT